MNSIASSCWTTGATASTHGKISRISVARSMKALPLNLPNFQRLLVIRFLAWQAATFPDTSARISFITQNFDYDWTDHSIGYQPEVNQYEAARCMTVAGCDIYHPSQSLLTGEEITFCGNISRSLRKTITLF